MFFAYNIVISAKPAAAKKADDKKESTTQKPGKKPSVEVIENEKVKADSAKKTGGKARSKSPGKSKARKFPKKTKLEKVCSVVPAPKPPCNTTEYGCCPDGVSPAKGPFEAGIYFV